MLYEVSAGVKKGHVHFSTGFGFGNNKLYAVVSKQGEAWTVRAKRAYVQIPIRVRADVLDVGAKAKVFTTIGWSYQVLTRQAENELSRDFIDDNNGLMTLLNPDFYQYYVFYNNQTNSHLFNLGIGLEYQFGSNQAFFIAPTYEAGTRAMSVYNIFVKSARENGQTAYIINRATNFGIQTGFSFFFN